MSAAVDPVEVTVKHVATVDSLRYSAALHRAVSSGRDRADTLDAQADRIERRLIKPSPDREEPDQ